MTTKQLINKIPKNLRNTDYCQYAIKALKGEIVVGNLVRLAIQRFCEDFDNKDYYFDDKKVQRCFSFFHQLKHYTGKSSGQHFDLLPWQSFYVANIIGWIRKDDDTRRFTNSVLEVARKNGKTAIVSALALYFLLADGEDSAQVAVASNSKEQAGFAYDACKNYLLSIDPNGALTKAYKDRIECGTNKLRCLASDSSKTDGGNYSFIIIDECGGDKTGGKLRDSLVSSMGMRTQPHVAYISTPYMDLSNWFYQLRCVGVDVLNKQKTDEETFYLLYEIDEKLVEEGTFLDDESCWAMSNPCLDVTVTKKFIRSQINTMRNDNTQALSVKTKTLGIWCRGSDSDAYIPEQYVYKCMSREKVNLEEYRDCIAFIGIDLGQTSDLTALSILIVPDDGRKPLFVTEAYVPMSALQESCCKDLYTMWHSNGILNVTEGNCCDYQTMIGQVLKWQEMFTLISVGYDRYNSTSVIQTLVAQGIECQPVSQTVAGMNLATKELQRMIRSEEILIDKSEVTTYCFRSATVIHDYLDNVRTVKINYKTGSGSNKHKIDLCDWYADGTTLVSQQ